MTTLSIDKTNWYARMLEPLNNEAKISIINQLTSSILKKKSRKKKLDMSFYDGLTGAWEDGESVEETVKNLRESRRFDKTRIIEE